MNKSIEEFEGLLALKKELTRMKADIRKDEGFVKFLTDLSNGMPIDPPQHIVIHTRVFTRSSEAKIKILDEELQHIETHLTAYCDVYGAKASNGI